MAWEPGVYLSPTSLRVITLAVSKHCSPPLSTIRILKWWLMVTGIMGSVVNTSRAQEDLRYVVVRSIVVHKPSDKPLNKPFEGFDAPERRKHGQIYGALSVMQVTTKERLLKPVDETRFMDLVGDELSAHGYHLAVNGQKPEIILTFYYGRGWLNLENGLEMPSGKVGREMLYIQVSAQQCPSDPKDKSKQLWNTTMGVYDPDRWDLNEIAQKMLEAGAPYFDGEDKELTVDFYKQPPEGRVFVGTPVPVESAMKKPR